MIWPVKYLKSRAVRPGFVFTLCLLTFSCSHKTTTSAPEYILPEIPEQREDGWTVSSLEEQDMDPELIGQASWEIQNGDFEEIHGLLIIRHGKLVFEEYYWEDHNIDFLHNLNSITKSIASAAVGIAVDQGLILDINKKISDFFPEHADLINLDPQKREMELWHLLTMSAGFEWTAGVGFETFSDSYAMMHSDDEIRFVLEKPIVTEPGAEFFYNDGLTMILDGIIRKVSGEGTDEFAQEFLFDPLGITSVHWKSYSDIYTSVDGGLQMRARDLAKIGQLYLDNGKWENQQIISEDWIKSSVTPWIQADADYYYGFQWWLEPLINVPGIDSQLNDIYLGSGFGGQKLLVIPRLDLVVVFQGCCHTNDCPPATEIVEQVILYNNIIPSIRDK
jgi:CubicO group peptidase (beta-lactamase class C family)